MQQNFPGSYLDASLVPEEACLTHIETPSRNVRCQMPPGPMDMHILFIPLLGDSEKPSSFIRWSQGMDSWLSPTVTTSEVSPWTGSPCLPMDHAGGPSHPVPGISSPSKSLTAPSCSSFRKGDPGQGTVLNIAASLFIEA